jgi:hypothetical protein
MRDRQTALLLFVVLTVLACTGYVAYLRTHQEDLGSLIPGTAANHGRFSAVVVFRPEDCDGRIDFMHAFGRVKWRESFSTSALVIGGRTEAKEAEQTLRARGIPMPVAAIRSDAHPGRFLGYASTPYLLVMDRQDRLRIAIPGPSSISEMRAFERATEGLLDSTPQTR